MLHMLNQEIRPLQFWVYIKGVTSEATLPRNVVFSEGYIVESVADPTPVPLPIG